MKVQVTQTATHTINEDFYKKWLEENESEKSWNDMTDTEKLRVIQDCKDEDGYEEIIQEIDNWKTEISLAV